jgi:hypothetical protein
MSPGASRGIPDSLHQRLWPFIPIRGFLGTVWWLSSQGASHRVFRSTLQGLNQSIVGSTSHEIPNDGS